MNASQISSLQSVLQKIEDTDMNATIATVFLTQDLETVRLGQRYLVPEYVAVVKRITTQFLEEVAVNGFYLPITYQYEGANQNLQNDLNVISNTFSNISQQTLNSSVPIIDRLVGYQIIYGFWDRATRKVHSTSDVKIKDLEAKLGYVAEQLKQNLAKQEESIKQLGGEKDKLTQFTAQKQQELQQITNNLNSTNTTNQQVSQLLTTATATNGKIEAVLKTQETNLEEQKKKIDSQVKEFETHKSSYSSQKLSIDEKIQTVDQQIGEFKNYLEFVESKTSYFEDRNAYLDTLIEREVGASLFETFKLRKRELEKPVNRWLGIVIGASCLTFIAVLAIFTNIFGWLGDVPVLTWQNVVVNALKSSPFFFLLFYSIAQYNKERHYQEEYAFKSAVALTIKAYADVIQAQELKDNLIVRSVTEVYKTPHPDKGKRNKSDNSILGTARELLATALEVMQKK